MTTNTIGTGKTTTIACLLNCLHLTQFHKYYTSLMKAVGRLRDQTPKQEISQEDSGPLSSILKEMDSMNQKFGRIKVIYGNALWKIEVL